MPMSQVGRRGWLFLMRARRRNTCQHIVYMMGWLWFPSCGHTYLPQLCRKAKSYAEMKKGNGLVRRICCMHCFSLCGIGRGRWYRRTRCPLLFQMSVAQLPFPSPPPLPAPSKPPPPTTISWLQTWTWWCATSRSLARLPSIHWSPGAGALLPVIRHSAIWRA